MNREIKEKLTRKCKQLTKLSNIYFVWFFISLTAACGCLFGLTGVFVAMAIVSFFMLVGSSALATECKEKLEKLISEERKDKSNEQTE